MSSKIDYTPVLNVPLSDALFTVDTRDGLKTSNGYIVATVQNNPYDINIQKNQQLFSGAVQRIALTELNMPWNIPNVNTYNNVLYLENELTGDVFALGDDPHLDDLGAVVATTNIQPGFYKPEELATLLTTTLNLGDGVFGTVAQPIQWTVSFSSSGITDPVANVRRFTISNRIRATGLGGIAFRVNPRYGQSKGRGVNPLFTNDTNNRSDTLATMMGFGYTGEAYRTDQVGNYASMQYTSYVDIVSSVLCKNQNVRDTSTSYFTGNNILARVYLSGDKIEPFDKESVVYTMLGATGSDYTITSTTTVSSSIIGTRPFNLHYEFPVPKEIQWNPEEFLPSCNIRLQDMYGNLLYYATPTPTALGFSWAGNSSFVQLNMLISEAGKINGRYSAFI
jgi:hypothetical protein